MRFICLILAGVLLGTSTAQFDEMPLNRPPDSKLDTDCRVPRINMVVCGSDGFEYVNKDELMCAMRIDTGLSLAYEGRCKEVVFDKGAAFNGNPFFNRFNRGIDENKPMGDRQ